MNKIFIMCWAIGIFTICSCEKTAGPSDKPELSATMTWQSTFGCFDGVFLGLYYGNIEVSGATQQNGLRIFYGDSLVIDTVIKTTDARTFEIIEYNQKVLKNILIVSGQDTLELASSDSMYGTYDNNTYHAFPVNFSIGLDTSIKRISLIRSDSSSERIRCSFDNQSYIDTIWTKRKSGILEINMLADVYANEYKIFTSVFDSSGTEHTAGEYSSSFPLLSGKKSNLKRSLIRFSNYLPYLPAEIFMPLDGGFGGYHLRIEHSD